MEPNDSLDEETEKRELVGHQSPLVLVFSGVKGKALVCLRSVLFIHNLHSGMLSKIGSICCVIKQL